MKPYFPVILLLGLPISVCARFDYKLPTDYPDYQYLKGECEHFRSSCVVDLTAAQDSGRCTVHMTETLRNRRTLSDVFNEVARQCGGFVWMRQHDVYVFEPRNPKLSRLQTVVGPISRKATPSMLLAKLSSAADLLPLGLVGGGPAGPRYPMPRPRKTRFHLGRATLRNCLIEAARQADPSIWIVRQVIPGRYDTYAAYVGPPRSRRGVNEHRTVLRTPRRTGDAKTSRDRPTRSR